MAEQPNGLSHWGNEYYCGNCFDGYFWNDENKLCDKCSIKDCIDCSSETECVWCWDGFIPAFGNLTCQHKIKDKNCNIAYHLQPAGLAWDSNEERWECRDCKPHHFYNE